jgi:hypothetical protein
MVSSYINDVCVCVCVCVSEFRGTGSFDQGAVLKFETDVVHLDIVFTMMMCKFRYKLISFYSAIEK